MRMRNTSVRKWNQAELNENESETSQGGGVIRNATEYIGLNSAKDEEQ